MRMDAALFDIVNPATAETVAAVEHDCASDVAAAAERARRAQTSWGAKPWRERAAVIRRFHDLAIDRADLVLDTIQSESGKARRDALAEVLTVAGTARYYLAHGRRHLREQRKRAGVPLLTSARVAWRPHGLVGLITPWNFPFLLAVGDALPALLAGNAVLVKASETTPRSALLARDLLVQAGLDPDLFAVIVGPGSELGQPLIDAVDYVGFTGSTATGRIVAEAAARRLIPCSLELGGKNPMLVLPGVRVDDAVHGLISAAFANSGQTCICVERAYVHEQVWDEFVAKATTAVDALDVRWSPQFDADMGSLIGPDHAAKVRGHLRDAIDKGATVLAGGIEPPDGASETFVRPTLLAGVDDSMLLARDETFGPVVSLVKVSSVDEAVRLANDSDLGLNASVWAGSRREALDAARRLEVGTVNINSSLLVYNTYDVPMGGIRRSGIGRRHGAIGIQRYCRQLSIVKSFSRGGGYELLLRAMNSPERARMLLRIVKLWRRVPGMR